ncbi:DUF885 domain-containing protein [Winogradskyella sp. MH6]|uniref:DUF885 domain-containing protein n=1 Tax=Winogradskyella sp. MH6 TaxID=2929510 RepID=UPI001FB51E7C|nr:DUF885 domain-containing protein [Winogradskyella sp. MH6]
MMYSKLHIRVILLLVSQILFSQNKNFEAVRKDFAKNYIALQIPYHQANYVQNLKSIKPIENIIQQEIFFKTVEKQLTNVDVRNLNEYERLDYHLMNYEVELNLERISLEKQWDNTIELDDKKSIYTIENGKNWYAYLLKKWVDITVTPDAMFQFGLDEIEKVKSSMTDIQVRSGFSEKVFQEYLKHSSFFLYNIKDIQQAFENTKREVAKKATNFFPYFDKISDVEITQGTNASLSHVPAYYNNGTFYFNYFNEPFNKRQLDWIYIHEGVPGHHYQIMVNDIIERTDIQQLFWYSGFVEGWGAYVEYLGKKLGVYKTLYDEYGKWEWDLIRSVRVALDVGINYYGWSDEKAISFWKVHISDQDDIGWREIARMKRWPAQVITYKYCSDMFFKLLNEAKDKERFDYQKFHKELLMYGDIPMSLLEFNLKND